MPCSKKPTPFLYLRLGGKGAVASFARALRGDEEVDVVFVVEARMVESDADSDDGTAKSGCGVVKREGG